MVTLVPKEKLKGLSSFKQYKKELKYRSPALRKALYKARQDEIKKAVKAEVKKIQSERKFRERPISATTQQLALQEAKAQERQRKIGFIGSRAEQLEIQAVSFNEVPLLHSMERERTRITTPPDRNMTRIIKDVSDSFPQ